LPATNPTPVNPRGRNSISVSAGADVKHRAYTLYDRHGGSPITCSSKGKEATVEVSLEYQGREPPPQAQSSDEPPGHTRDLPRAVAAVAATGDEETKALALELAAAKAALEAEQAKTAAAAAAAASAEQGLARAQQQVEERDAEIARLRLLIEQQQQQQVRSSPSSRL
jgi:hypothetical protein